MPFSNYATSSVGGGAAGSGTPLQAADTTLNLPTGDGAKFAAAPFRVQLGTTTGAHELVRVTAVSGDVLTLVRGQEGTTAQQWAVGTVAQAEVTAATLNNLGLATYNVREFGAVGDGVTDDSAAIQAAINQTGLASPAAPTATGNTGTGSAFTAGQTVNVQQSYVTATGETGTLNTLVTVAGSGNNVVVTLPGSFPATVTGMNVYASTASGSTTLYKVTSGAAATSTTPGAGITITGFAPNTTSPAPTATPTGTGKGGIIYFPASTYKINTGLVAAQDNLVFIGDGFASQILAGAGITMLTIQPPGPTGNFRYGLVVRDLFFNGNNVASTNGIDGFGLYAALFEHVRIRFVTGISIHLDGYSGGFGAYNYIRDCHITDGGATAAGVQTDDSEWLTIQGCQFGFFSGGTGIAVKLQNLNNRIIGTSFDHNDTSVHLSFAGRNIVSGCQFDRGGPRYVYLQGAKESVVANNFFGNTIGTPVAVIVADSGSND
ncbi:MAG TPA: glycosyl hydrolase family 28-related protein, partial [Ktedonobacterales bacterium]|nr:glycosyl hydrolase family 28-related protein [Ktedonobacterales bacterium]